MDLINRHNIPLKIPVEFKPKFMPELDETVTKNQILPLTPADINKEWVDWLADNNMFFKYARIFYAKPGAKYNLHVDIPTENPNRVAKINYIYGGEGSYMQWFQLKPGKSPYQYFDSMGDRVRGYKEEDCDCVHSENIVSPSLIDGGTIHTLINPTHARCCFSMALSSSATGNWVEFPEAVDRLKEFLV
jgi:hypothetical protein